MALGVSRIPLFVSFFCVFSVGLLDPPQPFVSSRAVLYFGAFHRIHCILCGCGSASGALQGDGKEVLQAGSLGKRDGSLELVSSKI